MISCFTIFLPESRVGESNTKKRIKKAPHEEGLNGRYLRKDDLNI